jgi:hypothetical protein
MRQTPRGTESEQARPRVESGTRRKQLPGMGGQGMIPEDGKGGIVEGTRESQQRSQAEAPHGPAPRAGMQGTKERGAAPTQTLERPGTSPVGTPGSGGGIGKTPPEDAPCEGGRVQDPKSRNTP